MPKNKSHKGLQKRIKITKTGKIRFRAPHGRHLKSNKTGTKVQSYRKNRYAHAGDLVALSKMVFRPLRSEQQAELEEMRKLETNTGKVRHGGRHERALAKEKVPKAPKVKAPKEPKAAKEAPE